MMKRKPGLSGNATLLYLSLLLLLFGSEGLFAQVNYPGKPSPLDRATTYEIPFITLPLFDREEFINKVSAVSYQTKPYLFGKDFAMTLHTGNSGIWCKTDDGYMTWRVGFKSPDALSMGVTFDRFRIPAGARLFVYTPGGKELRGAFTTDNMNPSGNLVVAPVSGDSLIVEYQAPGKMKDPGNLRIALVTHGLSGLYGSSYFSDSLADPAGSCNVDINCNEGLLWQAEKHSVCRILVHKYETTQNNDTIRWREICSGVLVNNARNDGKPYLLSANHCIKDPYEAENAIFYFNYESPYCNGPDGPNNQSLSGSSLKATSDKIDFTLVELNRIPPLIYLPVYAGWDRSFIPPSQTVCIHHPQGDVKKISFDLDTPQSSSYGDFDIDAFWLVKRWDTGTTEIGSSGSPLFNTDHRIIGLLSGGLATCSDPIDDYFSKIAVAWSSYPDSVSQLKCWLDPDGLDLTTMNFLDPYYISKETCDTVMNFQSQENQILYDYSTEGNGYWSGHNAGRYTQFAERIGVAGLNYLTGAFLHVAVAEFNNENDAITMKIWSGDTCPENPISSKEIPIDFFTDSSWFFMDFDSLIEVSESFWIGYEVTYDSDTGALTDQFALFQTEDRGALELNSAALYKGGIWSKYSDETPVNIYTSLGIKVVLCNEVFPMAISEYPGSVAETEFILYPNPSAGEFYLHRRTTEHPGEINLEIYHISGALVFTRRSIKWENTARLGLSFLPAGFYILRITEGVMTHSLKFSVIK